MFWALMFIIHLPGAAGDVAQIMDYYDTQRQCLEAATTHQKMTPDGDRLICLRID